jgi:hypothetical protein
VALQQWQFFCGGPSADELFATLLHGIATATFVSNFSRVALPVCLDFSQASLPLCVYVFLYGDIFAGQLFDDMLMGHGNPCRCIDFLAACWVDDSC